MIKTQFETHSNEDGEVKIIIDNLCFSSVLKITSKENTSKGNCYHINDRQFCYVICGQVKLLKRPVGSKEKPQEYIINSGESFIINSLEEYVILFLKKTIMDCYCRLPRDEESYEEDTVKLNFNLLEI